MKKKKILFFIVMLCSCTVKNDSLLTIKVDKDKGEISFVNSKIIDEVKLLPLYSSDSLMLGGEYSVKIIDDLIYINDYNATQKIVVFDNKGNCSKGKTKYFGSRLLLEPWAGCCSQLLH